MIILQRILHPERVDSMRCFLWFILISLLLSPPGGQKIYMRVVARDDSAAGQTEKYAVRDAALAACPENGAGLLSTLPGIERAARTVAPDSWVRLCFWRPDKKTPAAPTVYITVGSGGGHNWWGILYEDALALAEEEDGEGPLSFDWPFLAWLKRLLGL